MSTLLILCLSGLLCFHSLFEASWGAAQYLQTWSGSFLEYEWPLMATETFLGCNRAAFHATFSVWLSYVLLHFLLGRAGLGFVSLLTLNIGFSCWPYVSWISDGPCFAMRFWWPPIRGLELQSCGWRLSLDFKKPYWAAMLFTTLLTEEQPEEWFAFRKLLGIQDSQVSAYSLPCTIVALLNLGLLVCEWV